MGTLGFVDSQQRRFSLFYTPSGLECILNFLRILQNSDRRSTYVHTYLYIIHGRIRKPIFTHHMSQLKVDSLSQLHDSKGPLVYFFENKWGIKVSRILKEMYKYILRLQIVDLKQIPRILIVPILLSLFCMTYGRKMLIFSATKRPFL